MALAFDASDKFGYDKPAGEPCRHLDVEFRCTIHDKRGDLGFAVGLIQQFIGYLVSLPGAYLWIRGRRDERTPQARPTAADM